jgi:hypothetical protein
MAETESKMTIARATTKACLGVVLVSLVVTPSQVDAQTCVPAPSGLVSWLPGDGNADDIAGGNHGTLRDGATFDAGLVGQAFSFDGTSSVTLGAAPTVPTQGSWTYDLWINVHSYINGGIDDGFGSYFVDRTAETQPLADLKAVAGKFAFQVRYDDGTGVPGSAPVGGDIVLDQWTHVAMVRDYNSEFRLYVDGQLVAHSADNGKALTPHTPKLGHHDLPALSGFVGLIDEFEIFDRALSKTELQAIVGAGSGGKCKVRTVAIDIKPDSFPNSINLSSSGVVPVAILSSALFDAVEVNPATITLAGAAVRLIGRVDKFSCHTDDVNEDGRHDLICHIETVQFMIAPGESVAVLEAKTWGGQSIRGEDSINIVK